MTTAPTRDTPAHGQTPTIDEILARVRAELALEERPAASESGPTRRRGPVAVPLLAEEGVADISGAGGLTIDAFEKLDEETFLRTAYRILLDRDVDASGRIHYLPALRDGRSTAVGILGALRWSAEGKARGVDVQGLKRAYFLDRVARTPFIGRLAGPILRLARSARTLRRLHRRIAATDLRHREFIQAVNGSLMGVRSSLAQVDAVASEAHAIARKTIDGADAANRELVSARRMIAEASNNLTKAISDARATLPLDRASGTAGLNALDDHALDSLYVAFEDRFRGSKSDISRTLERYLTIFLNTDPVAAGGQVLDIGCGRGEWLALLKANNIAGRGVDLNEAMVEHCRSEGLEVIAGDAIAYLRNAPAGSFGGVTGFHIVEHLPFTVLVGLLNECYRALAPGGVILFETPNPENLVVGACTFHYDPTHKKPLPPDLMRFLAETRGYVDVRIVRSDDDCKLDQPESGFAPVEINDWFRQPPNYALFARKPLAAEAATEEPSVC